jgi:polysaccharide chain length determinant protein (PEP-CTERM system associated)
MERREMFARRIAEWEWSASAPKPNGGEALTSLAAPAPDPAIGRLGKLRDELAELRTRFSDKYPDVIRLKAEVAALEKQVAEMQAQPETPGALAVSAAPTVKRDPGPSPYLLQVKEATAEAEAELKALRSEEKRLQDDLTLYQRRVQNAPHREQEFQTLSRDYSTTSELYRTLLQRHEEAQLAESLEQRQKGEQFRIVEPAVPPDRPHAPNRFRLLVMGLMLSLGLGVAAVVAAEQLDTSFHVVEELRALAGAPVVVAIPRIVTQADAVRRRWRLRVAGVSALLAAAIASGSAYLVATGRVPLVSQVVYGLLLKS